MYRSAQLLPDGVKPSRVKQNTGPTLYGGRQAGRANPAKILTALFSPPPYNTSYKTGRVRLQQVQKSCVERGFFAQLSSKKPAAASHIPQLQKDPVRQFFNLEEKKRQQ